MHTSSPNLPQLPERSLVSVKRVLGHPPGLLSQDVVRCRVCFLPGLQRAGVMF